MAEQEKNKSRTTEILLDLMKWLIGTIGLGVVGICINKQIQESEVRIKRMEADTKLLEVVTKDVLRNNTDSLELRYLKFIETFITTDEIKSEVQERIEDLRKDIILNAETKVPSKANYQKNEIEKKLNPVQRSSFKAKVNEKVESVPEAELVDIRELEEEENTIASNLESIDSASIEILNEAYKKTAPVQVKEQEKVFALIGKPITKWSKKGYYVEFSNSLRIGVKNLSKNSVTINLKQIEQEELKLIDGEKKISEGEVNIVNFGDYRYQITLNYIGAAGKNPFTRAAYFTVLVYKRRLL